MLAAPVDQVPEGPNLIHEPKFDGWRGIVFRERDGVYVQSRAGRNLTTYFPDITCALRTAMPAGVVLDGELIVWERGRTNFAQLQRRVTAGRDLLRLAQECPAHYVVFDLLADAGGEVILNLPLSERLRGDVLYALSPCPAASKPHTTSRRAISAPIATPVAVLIRTGDSAVAGPTVRAPALILSGDSQARETRLARAGSAVACAAVPTEAS
ncbi:ATP-dependent DNA ligase [Micromonospora coerulea]|uniref:ATP-dependent DNA ligase n=1 Tax=Micromonospora coerulea TaxID=47856 RepID=UPI001F438ACD|nr:hypothetical protein [Micromonospora veneta]